MQICGNRSVQAAAKAVLAALSQTICPASTESTIAKAAVTMLCERGLRDTWYYECPALVLLGSRSCVSISGREYRPSNEQVGEYNLVTVDLSPCRGDAWGDCARSFYVESGVAREKPTTTEFVEGHELEARLHAAMQQFVTPDTTFHALHEFANDMIRSAGYENLDFLGNVGHSICTRKEDRVYIQAGNSYRLADVTCFTFEPHIRKLRGRWGFKHENIYFFQDSALLLEL
jgi:Xaa-Pro aminopeptidase